MEKVDRGKRKIKVYSTIKCKKVFTRALDWYNKAHMLKVVYIPTSPLSENTQNNGQNSTKRPLSDKIQDILLDFDNKKLGSKKALFIQEAFKLLDLDNEELSGLSISIHSNYNRLIQLYFSSGLHDEISLERELINEWNNMQNDRDSTVILWEKSFYEIFQSDHGDVSLTHVGLPNQCELFPKQWENINDYPIESIRSYQETIPLVWSLLLWYHHAGWSIEELENISTLFEWMSSLHCNAADSWTKNSDLYFVQSYFDWPDKNSTNLGISIYSWNQQSYSTFFDAERKEVVYWKYNKGYTTFVPYMRIPFLDIPQILLWLCRFPWRSWNGWKILIEWYIEKFKTLSQ